MKDLVSLDLVELAQQRRLLIEEGFQMLSEDEPKEKNQRYSMKGIFEYTRIVSSSNPDYVSYVLRRKI